jgi:RND family efflux transporter MFP subunit
MKPEVRWLVFLVLWLITSGAMAAGDEEAAALSFAGVDSGVGLAPEDKGIPTLDCLLTPSVDTKVASPVPGVLAAVAVRRGDRVKKGQVLFRLRSEAEQATLHLKAVQAAYGARTIQRNDELYRQKLISEQDKDDIIMQNRVYALEKAQAQVAVDQKTTRSPINGVVVDTFLEPGEYVGTDAVVELAQLDPLYVEVTVPARYFGQIRAGARARVTLDAPLSSTHEAWVSIVDQVIDAASGTYRVRLELPNQDYRLPSGLKCRVSFAW